MTRLLHLSDLHFGRTRPELVQPLIEAAAALAPDATLVSGDLTQRAREWQFEEAAHFLDALPQPLLVVPGNHDIPLDRPFQRFLRPFANYRAAVTPDLEPMFDLPGVRVIGINTAWPFSWEHGRARRRSLALAETRLQDARDARLRVVVMHHPLVHPPGEDKDPMDRADEAARRLAQAGADLVLAGHLHAWGAAVEELREGRRRMLLVQAGTGISSRVRAHENDFNVIDLQDGPEPMLRITRHAVAPGGGGFVPGTCARFTAGPDGWRPVA